MLVRKYLRCNLTTQLINYLMFLLRPPPKVEVEEQYLPPCGNGGIGPNCETSNGYNYDRPAVAFRY